MFNDNEIQYRCGDDPKTIYYGKWEVGLDFKLLLHIKGVIIDITHLKEDFENLNYYFKTEHCHGYFKKKSEKIEILD